MREGTVKFFNEEKGYGFIKPESGDDVFVHSTGLKTEIRKNDRVRFDVKQGKNGPTAVSVEVI